METYDAVIIGAGHNGLACAALLAKAGHSVAVFERADRIGGATVSVTDVWPGYTLSAASYVCSLLDPWLVDELELRAHGFDFYRKDPYAFTPLEDGRSLLFGSDAAANAREIEKFDPRDVAGFAAYGERTERAGRALFDSFSDEEPRFDRFDADTQALLRGSAAELVEKYVRTPVIQAELVNDGLIGTNSGPRDAGTGYVLAHHLAGRVLGVQGAWAFVRGGMGAVSGAIADAAARQYGAQIFADARVERVVTFGGRAIGVACWTTVAKFAARAVASNAHPRTTFIDLLGCRRRSSRRSSAKCSSWKTDGPSLKLNLALGELPNFTAVPARTRSRTIARRSTSPRRSTTCRKRTRTRRTAARARRRSSSAFCKRRRIRRWLRRANTSSRSSRNTFRSTGPAVGATRNARRLPIRSSRFSARFAPNLPERDRASPSARAARIWKTRFGLIGGHIFHGELLPGQIYEDRFATRTPVESHVPVRFGRASGRLRDRISRQASGVRDSKRPRCGAGGVSRIGRERRPHAQ